MARSVRFALIIAAIAALLALSGCGSSGAEAVSPVVEAPAIGTSGVLKAGIDLSAAPYGGVDQGREAGIDVDVAAALAERLGLELDIVHVKASDAATALAGGKVDVVFSVPFAETAKAGVTSAGTYLDMAPGFFAAREGSGSVDSTITLDTLSAKKVAVQESSPAFWALRYELGEAALEPFDTLRLALEALDDGKVEMVAGDAVVGSYIMRDLSNVAFVGQVAPAEPLAVVVAEKNTKLAEVVQGGLDELAADGVLETIRRKWVGELPLLTAVDTGEEPATP